MKEPVFDNSFICFVSIISFFLFLFIAFVYFVSHHQDRAISISRSMQQVSQMKSLSNFKRTTFSVEDFIAREQSFVSCNLKDASDFFYKMFILC